MLQLQTKSPNAYRELTLRVYQPQYKSQWDQFVANSKNGVFLFNRDYMEYHQNRFQDHSLLFFMNGELVALLPANLENHTLHSHAGLTFGSVISGSGMTLSLMLEVFGALVEHCKQEGITQVVYKTVPYIYHSAPADEDLYALFRSNARLIARNVSSAIYLPQRVAFDSRRKESLRKAKRTG